MGGGSSVFQSLSTVEVYDPALDKWTKKTDMPTAKIVYNSVVGNKIYLTGGMVAHPTHIATVEEYTPEGWPFAIFPQCKEPETWGRA